MTLAQVEAASPRVALDMAVEQAVKLGVPVALAILDIDNLSAINADLGFETGDRALSALAGIVTTAALGDVFRVAGDEFAVLMPGLALEAAFLRMESLRAMVETAAGAYGLPQDRSLTVGIGVAQYPRDSKTARGLFSAADAALGAAKDNGGNQVSLPPSEEMIMKSCYYSGTTLRRLKTLAERLERKESAILREALEDILRKYKADVVRDAPAT